MKLDIDSYTMSGTKKEKVHGKFINRELSWIEFNKRVLACSLRKIKFNEKLNFLGITESNLDEFISVRFANAYHNQEDEPYSKILKGIKDFQDLQSGVFKIIEDQIRNEKKYVFVKPENLNKKNKEIIHDVFENQIFNALVPMDITDYNINIESGVTYICVLVSSNNTEKLVAIPIIKSIKPFYTIDKNIIMVEDIILYYLKEILQNQKILAKSCFRIIKDGSVILSHDTNRFIVDRMKETIYNRETAAGLYLELRRKTDERLVYNLTRLFKIPEKHIYSNKRIINFKIFSSEKMFDSSETYPPFEPYKPAICQSNIFDSIKESDILLHHPYDSYDTVLQFIDEASCDSCVTTIKQTLYRVSGLESPIVNSLCRAADNGKLVVVLVEIKARFDEYNNIAVINKLSAHGVNVVYGDEFLKTHCKLCLVTRNENGNQRVYSHVATGNYNEKTARIYTDLSFFTCRPKIGRDLSHVFNILSGLSKPDDNLERVYYAPVNLRKQLEKCIDREIKIAKKGKKASIFIKVNSISDMRMVNKLYEAADAGVEIDILCRGVCSIVPRKNITIKSIVGRFLEHSRIYYFKNGKSPEYYISSADLLTRNLDRRVETLISLKETSVIKQLHNIIEALKKDEYNSFFMTKDGDWKKMNGNYDAHKHLIDHRK